MRVLLFYRNAPGHPFSGPITHSMKVREVDPFAWHAPHVVVDEWRADWDSTHYIEDGAPVPIPPRIVAATVTAVARVRLRVRRNGLLRDVIDPLLTNPVRWAEMTDAQQAKVLACRQALLDWPATEKRPRNPTPPDLEI